MLTRMTRWFRLHSLRFSRLRAPVETLARGAALGTVTAIIPTVPVTSILVILLAKPCRANLPAALIVSYLVCNPLTVAPEYYLVWRIGDLVFPGELTWEHIRALLCSLEANSFREDLKIVGALGWGTVKVMLTGGVLLSIPCGAVAYFAAYGFFERMRRRRESRICGADGSATEKGTSPKGNALMKHYTES